MLTTLHLTAYDSDDQPTHDQVIPAIGNAVEVLTAYWADKVKSPSVRVEHSTIIGGKRKRLIFIEANGDVIGHGEIAYHVERTPAERAWQEIPTSIPTTPVDPDASRKKVKLFDNAVLDTVMKNAEQAKAKARKRK